MGLTGFETNMAVLVEETLCRVILEPGADT